MKIVRETAIGRRGFSLFEMLLVMAILILTAALVWPSLDAAFAHYELRQAADLVRVNLTAARVHAIEQGAVYAFRFQLGEGNVTVATADESGLAFEPASASGTSAQAWTVDDTLPGNTRFSSESVVTLAESVDGGAASLDDAKGAQTLLFYPDGTTDDAILVLSNGKSGSIEVSLRGLTGVVTVSDLKTSNRMP